MTQPTPRPSARPETAPAVRAPATPEQVLGLRARRELLAQQLADATGQRDALAAQLRPGPGGPGLSPQLGAGVEQRVRVLDERILRIEREQSATEAALSAAAPEALARATGQRATAQTRDAAPDNLAANGVAIGAAAGVPVGVLLTLAVLAVRRGLRRRRSAGPAHPPARAEPLGTATGATRAADRRVAELATAVDAVAVEVERIGERQRFVTQLLVADRGGRAPGEKAPAADGPAGA